MGRLFGTDGVRGVANQDLTPELAYKLGRVAATVLTDGQGRSKLVIGRDTRISGHMLEAALVAGITSVGADVVLLGVVPTPAVAFLTRALQADAGVMISASHNPFPDNGIKFFAGTGFKLPDETEDTIEAMLDKDDLVRPTGEHIGSVSHEYQAINRYVEFLKESVPVNLEGLHVALDCANGAASFVATELLTQLGAEVSAISVTPTGVNINVECGSTHPEAVQAHVKQVGAHVGITLDGDADRVLFVDEQGALVDGDKVLAICGLELLAKGQLPQNKIAATIYSNGGLKQAFQQQGGDVFATKAGDRYVLEAMVEHGLALGGEQSGHIIFLQHNTTGDGMLTALKILQVLAERKAPLSKLAGQMDVFPQELVNVQVGTKDGWEENSQIQQAMTNAQNVLGSDGRIFVRPSGTEPLIRVMVEHPDEPLVKEVVQAVAAVIKAEQGA